MDTELLSIPGVQLKKLTNDFRHDPHSVLGLHFENKRKVIRLFRPGAHVLFLEVKGQIVQAECVHEAGLFEYEVSPDINPHDYRIYHQNGLLACDPYAFLPTFGTIDQHLFGKGVHYNLHMKVYKV